MKKTIKVSEHGEKNSFSGRRIEWNEEFTGFVTLEKDTTFYHVSGVEIKKFAPLAICLSTERTATADEMLNPDRLNGAELYENCREYLYSIILPAGTELMRFDYDTEFRIVLEPGQKFEFVGTVDTYRIRKELYNPKFSPTIRVLTLAK